MLLYLSLVQHNHLFNTEFCIRHVNIAIDVRICIMHDMTFFYNEAHSTSVLIIVGNKLSLMLLSCGKNCIFRLTLQLSGNSLANFIFLSN